MKNKAKKGTLGRLLKMIFGFYPVLLPFTLCCIVFSAVVSSMPSLLCKTLFRPLRKAGRREIGRL